MLTIEKKGLYVAQKPYTHVPTNSSYYPKYICFTFRLHHSSVRHKKFGEVRR